jgi:hypothetical protein
MTLPYSNITFSAIQAEFGGSNPISLSEYYKSGGYVRANSTGSMPTSGAISLSQFLGAAQGVTYPTAGTILSQGCVAYGSAPYTYRVTRADGSGGSYNEDTPNSPSCGYVAYPAPGTYLYQFCSGYNLYYVYADGSGGSYYSLYQSNSPTCGYSPPVPTATWSTGYSNNGTAGPISTFVAVNLSSAALSTVTFSFSGVVVQNGVAYSVPNVTIASGQTSGSANTFSGVYNGSGPYVGITLRATVTSAPYTITNGSTIDTAFSYSA